MYCDGQHASTELDTRDSRLAPPDPPASRRGAYILGKLKTRLTLLWDQVNRMVRAALQVTFAVVAVVSGAAGACNPKLGRTGTTASAPRPRLRRGPGGAPRHRRGALRGRPSAQRQSRRGRRRRYRSTDSGSTLLGAYDASPSQAGATPSLSTSTTYQTVRGFGNAFPTLQPYTLPR